MPDPRPHAHPRHEGVQLHLRGQLATDLRRQADRRGQEPADLLGELLGVVLTDDLVDAILEPER